MSIKDSYNNKKVTFDTKEGLEDKIDRLTVMMSKLATNKEGTNKQLKPYIYQSKRRGQTRNFYDRPNYQNRYRSNIGDRRIQFSDRIQYEENYRGGPRYGQIYRNDYGRGNYRGNMKMYQRQNFRGQQVIEEVVGMQIMKEVEVGQERDHFQITIEGMTEVIVTVGQGQDQE